MFFIHEKEGTIYFIFTSRSYFFAEFIETLDVGEQAGRTIKQMTVLAIL